MAEKILVVDDDLDTLKLIGMMLQRQGYGIVAASGGAQALAKVNEEKPDLIILDIMMPDMDGYAVARRLRADPNSANIPIIMFTAKTTVDDKVAGFEAGADDYLTKPTHPAELASRVKVLLSRSVKRTGPLPGEPGQIISFIGVKGGVGTTTLALNVAVAILQQARGQSVIFAETRPAQGSVGLMLGLPRTQGLGNLLRTGFGKLSAEEIEAELVRDPCGLTIMAASSLHDANEASIPIGKVEVLVRNLGSIADYVVLDLGHGLSEQSRRLATISKQVVICLEPHRVAIALAQEMLQELQDLGLGPLRTSLVLNNRTPSSLQTSWQAVQQTLEKEVLAIISPAPELAYQALESQRPLILLQPESITAGQLRKLGEDLLGLLGPVSAQLTQ